MRNKILIIMAGLFLVPLLVFAQDYSTLPGPSNLPQPSSGDIFRNILMWIFGIFGFVSILLPFIGIAGVIISAIFLAKAKEDAIKKKKAIKWLIISGVVIVLGFILPLFGLVGFSLLR